MDIEDLKVGDRVRVLRPFTDFDGRELPAGWEGRLVAKDYFAYDDGYTLAFDGGRFVRLSGNVPGASEIIGDDGNSYWCVLPD